ncbi:MAG: ABC transporter ATP-binding protein [SAR202 cluster bacterium]|nr:ABC transporter ATP-binding protein [SAR202 cluster bacterium]
MGILFRILGQVYRRHRWRVLAGYGAVVLASLSALAIPSVLGDAVNRVLGDSDTSTSMLYLLALVVLLAGAARGLFSLGQMYIGDSIAQRYAYELRNEFFAKLQDLSFGFHDKQKTGVLMSRATSDVDGVRQFITQGAIRLGFIVAMVGGIAIAMLLTDVTLAVVSLAFVPFLIWRAIATSQHLRKGWMKVQQHTGQMAAVLQENLTGNRVVKAFGGEPYEIEKFNTRSSAVAREGYMVDRDWAKNFSIMNFGFLASMGVVLWVGGMEVIEGRQVVDGAPRYTGLTPGELTAFIFYLGLLSMPVRMSGWMVNSISRAISCGQRLFEIIDTETEVKERPGAKEVGRAEGRVRFEGVTFGYEGGPPAIKDLNLTVEAGQRVALMGQAGSGKSTLAHLLLRFYDVDAGRITIDGVDVREVTLGSLRRNVGIVQQDVFVHAMSVKNNIAFGRPEAGMEEILHAAKVAQLHDFIESLPQGYETMVGERGITLSGGQKQRLAIARTLVVDPPVLILDDSTSSVDAQTDYMLHRALQEATRNRTTFIITHRLNAIRDADMIVVFREGQVVERGTHEELLARGGEYADIYEYQLRPQEEARRVEVADGGGEG